MKVYCELGEILYEWIDIYKKEGKTLPSPGNKKHSGNFVVHTGSDLHKGIAIKALNTSDSLNNFVIKKI